MSIADEINQLNSNLSSSYTSVNNKEGTLPTNQCFDNLPDAIDTITEGGDLTTLNVTPTTSAQTITPSGDIDGYNLVEVAAVTSSIDNNIQPENIITGKTILNVNGSATVLNGETRSVSLTSSSGQTYTPSTGKNAITSITVTPNNQARTVNPSTSQQSLTVNSGYSGNGTITVNAVTSSIDSNITAANIVSGKSILGVNGSATVLNGETRNVSLISSSGQTFTPSSGKNAITSITVTPYNKAQTITPTTSSQTINIPSGYSGNGKITVNAVTSDIDSDIVATNIKSGVNILGINGSLTPVNNTTLEITPSTSAQSLSPSSPYTGYDSVDVAAVTSSIDSNITAANIVSGKTILGVSGSATVLNGETRTVSITSTAGNTFTPSSGKNGITSIKVTPTNKAQTITPSTSSQTLSVPSNYSGYGTLTVNAVTSSIDSNIKAANIVSGKSILGVSGTATVLNGETQSVSLTSSSGNTFTPSSGKNAITSITVTPNNQARTVTPTTSQQSLTVNSGYSGNGTITVNAVTNTIDNNITQGNIKSGVTILGVTGNFDPSPTINSLNITPSLSSQTITASGGVDGYSPINVSAVTSSIDSNIQAEYIRYGIDILGIIGTYGDPVPGLISILGIGNSSGYIKKGGDLYLCGRNDFGQQGNGTTTNVTTFTKRTENVAQICLTNETSGYLTTSGDFYLCGRNYYGQQGDGTTTNVTTFTKRAENVAQILVTEGISGYITTSGDLYLCGKNNSGQQGNGTAGSSTNVKTFTKRAENVAQIFSGDYGDSTGYLTPSGDLYLCGTGSSGQQGSGTTTNVTTFTKRAENVAQVFLTQNTSGYLTTSGDFYLCGKNNYGQQGSGNTTNVTTFTKRAEKVKQIFSGDYGHTTGYLTLSGDLYLCGYNIYGQQGSGDTTNVTTFTKRAENVKQVVLSAYTSGYLTTSGDFYLCGSNSYGQQSSGDTTNVTTFTKRAENVAQIFLAQSSSGYLTPSNDLYLCGRNYYGQQGDGTTTNVTTFTKRAEI